MTTYNGGVGPHVDEAARQAAELVVDEEENGGSQKELIGWLRQSPRYVEEYLAASAVWELLAGHDFSAHGPRARSKRRWFGSAAAAAAVVAVGTAAWLYSVRDAHRTDIGELKSFQLVDNTVVFLNADSKISVNFTAQEREVRLHFGEAAFDVASEAARPFVVSSGSTRIIAVGTEFVVRRDNGDTTVTVVEGHVVVESEHDRVKVRKPSGEKSQKARTTEERALGPRDRLTLTGSGEANASIVLEGEDPASWISRRLVFDHEPLGNVVTEFNRFNTARIVVEDETLRQLEISAVFEADDPDSLLDFLRSLDGVVIEKRSPGLTSVGTSAGLN